MSSIKDTRDYVMNSLHNTNPAMLNQYLKEVQGTGTGSSDLLKKSLYILPYKCKVLYAGEINPETDKVDNDYYRIEMTTGYSGANVIVFCGEKMGDNKYFTGIGRIIESDHDRMLKLSFTKDLDYFAYYGRGDTWPAIHKGVYAEISAEKPSSYQDSVEQFEYRTSIETPHFLTIYEFGDFEEYDLELQLEDYLPAEFLPIPTMISAYGSYGACSKTEDQIRYDIERGHTQAKLDEDGAIFESILVTDAINGIIYEFYSSRYDYGTYYVTIHDNSVEIESDYNPGE